MSGLSCNLGFSLGENSIRTSVWLSKTVRDVKVFIPVGGVAPFPKAAYLVPVLRRPLLRKFVRTIVTLQDQPSNTNISDPKQICVFDGGFLK